MAVSFQAALLNGGPVSLSYGVILASLGVYSICLSLGEMASMYVRRCIVLFFILFPDGPVQ